MMVWYLVPSRDPELLVAVGWKPALASFVGRVEGAARKPGLDSSRSTVAWFGRRPHELPTVQHLQEAIGDYTVLASKVRAALEADQASQPPALAAEGGGPPDTSIRPPATDTRVCPAPRPEDRWSWPCWSGSWSSCSWWWSRSSSAPSTRDLRS